jgi:hypothetical protein
MKRRTLQLVALVLGLLPAAPAVRAAGPQQVEASAYELCIEHSPARAGTVTPNVGTHRFTANSVVTLSAVPQPGYRFAYWVGDVSDPDSEQTTVRVDTPKMVVAVFRSVREEKLDRKISLGGGGGGPSKLTPLLVDLKTPGFSVSGGGIREVAVPKPVPVVVTPEPTTILLLGLGAVAWRRKRR